MFPFPLATVVLLFVARTVAHGFIYRVIIDGKAYVGNQPGSNSASSPSIIRHVADQSPVKGATNPDINCGQSAQKAQLVANANPGSTIEFDWREANLAKWPHNTGPMLTYMTSCGSVSCDQYDSTNADWFKIEQVGKKDDDTWYQADIMAGKTAVVNIPDNLAPGNYLIRHEIIALHLGVTEGGAEFYPGCAQLKVGGDQTGAPAQSDLVKLPGAYSDTDPGIWDPDVYDSKDPYNQQKMPGPPVAEFIAGSNTPTNSTTGSTTRTSSSSRSTGTSTSSPSSPTTTTQPKCSLRRAATPSTLAKRRAQHRRHNMWDMIKISISAF